MDKDLIEDIDLQGIVKKFGRVPVDEAKKKMKKESDYEDEDEVLDEEEDEDEDLDESKDSDKSDEDEDEDLDESEDEDEDLDESEDEDEDLDESEDEDEDEEEETVVEKKKKMKKESYTPKTKASLTNLIYRKITEMSQEELIPVYNSLVNGNAKPVSESVKLSKSERKSLNDLVSKSNLDESFKGSVTEIFENSLKVRVDEEVEKLRKETIDSLEESYNNKLEEEVDNKLNELADKVDSYLSYVVEQWISENEVAIETSLRTEIAENFIGQMKTLFTENYIQVPESKTDVLDSLAEEVAELEEQLNSTTEKLAESNEQLSVFAQEIIDYKKKEIVEELTGDLSEHKKERILELAEDIEFTSITKYKEKVGSLIESIGSKPSIRKGSDTLHEEVELEDEINPRMAEYLAAVSKQSKGV